MGIDRKGKEKKSRKRTSSMSSSEDEGRRRKRRRSDDERRNRKSDKKEKRKDKKSHRHHSDKAIIHCLREEVDKHKSKRHKGDHHSKSEFQELSNDDYFSKNNEFATWLKEKKKMFFSDLSSESARELFSVFVKDWNSQKLESRYYEGISSAPRSAHNWAFKR